MALPGTPTAATHKDTDGTEHQWQLEAKNGGYIISYRDINGSSKLTDKVLDGALTGMGKALTSSKKIIMGGLSAREADAIIEPGTIGRVRMVIVNDRLYQFMIATKDKTIGPDADTFFNSVSLTGSGDAAKGDATAGKSDAGKDGKADGGKDEAPAKTDAPAKDDASAKPDAPAKDDAPAKTDAPAKDDAAKP